MKIVIIHIHVFIKKKMNPKKFYPLKMKKIQKIKMLFYLKKMKFIIMIYQKE